MTDLDRDLAEVVRMLDEVDGKPGMELEKMHMLSTAGQFIRTHHAEIARDREDARLWRQRFISERVRRYEVMSHEEAIATAEDDARRMDDAYQFAKAMREGTAHPAQSNNANHYGQESVE